jgi:two-component system nitrogen regulation response regulator NtrX
MIDVNCAAIPEELIESELFGHEKGAIAGASVKKVGKFELANKGTIFLDEIGDMSLKTQAKILRVLQEQQFQRVGGSRILSVDVRVIASSNKDLKDEIAKGRFREDIYYRLNVIPIDVSPLRNRLEDIPMLVETFLKECAIKDRGKSKTMAPEAVDLLCGYAWPGNVRELKNLIERLVIMVDKDIIDESDIPAPYNPACVEGTGSIESRLLLIQHFKDAQKAFEREFIQSRLMQYNNDIAKTAEAIGIEKTHLNQMLETYS